YQEPDPSLPLRLGVFFPAEAQRVALFFDGVGTKDVNATALKNKTETRTYDSSGNLLRADDFGDEQTDADDIRYVLGPYQDETGTDITRATAVEADALVAGQSGPMLRRRTATYAPSVGTLSTLTNIVSGGKVPATGMPGTTYNQASSIYTYTYDSFGNL